MYPIQTDQAVVALVWVVSHKGKPFMRQSPQDNIQCRSVDTCNTMTYQPWHEAQSLWIKWPVGWARNSLLLLQAFRPLGRAIPGQLHWCLWPRQASSGGAEPCITTIEWFPLLNFSLQICISGIERYLEVFFITQAWLVMPYMLCNESEWFYQLLGVYWNIDSWSSIHLVIA